jgi:hypothetical protein
MHKYIGADNAVDTASDYELFSAAAVTVRLAGLHAGLEESVGMYVSCAALLGMWGHARVARLAFEDVECNWLRQYLHDVQEDRSKASAFINLAAAQPFMSVDWTSDQASFPLPKSVAALLHDWQRMCGGPWTTNIECIRVAERYCLETARTALDRYGHSLPECWTRIDRDDEGALIELGAQISDMITPYGGDSHSPSMRLECGVGGFICPDCRRDHARLPKPSSSSSSSTQRKTTATRTSASRKIEHSSTSNFGSLDAKSTRSSVRDDPKASGKDLRRLHPQSRLAKRGKAANASTGR